MQNTPIAVLQEARRSLYCCLDDIRSNPDPTRRTSGTLKQIRDLLSRVDTVLRDADAALGASRSWQEEKAAYREALLETIARLANFEIVLRIRKAHVSTSVSRIKAIHSWSDLAKHIG